MNEFPSVVPITLFSKPGCSQCVTTVRYLERLGLPYDYRDVTEDPEAHAAVQALGYLGLPVVVAGDMHWSGFRHSSLKRLGEIHGSLVDTSDLDALAEQFLAMDGVIE